MPSGKSMTRDLSIFCDCPSGGETSRPPALGVGLGVVDGCGGAGFASGQSGVVFIKRGAIGTDDLAAATHVQKDMRMVVRRGGTHALELFHADANGSFAGIVGEFGGGWTVHLGIPVVLCGQTSLWRLLFPAEFRNGKEGARAAALRGKFD